MSKKVLRCPECGDRHVSDDEFDEILKDISDTYKLINFGDLEEPYKENARQARKKLNKIAGDINRFKKSL